MNYDLISKIVMVSIFGGTYLLFGLTGFFILVIAFAVILLILAYYLDGMGEL